MSAKTILKTISSYLSSISKSTKIEWKDLSKEERAFISGVYYRDNDIWSPHFGIRVHDPFSWKEKL